MGDPSKCLYFRELIIYIIFVLFVFLHLTGKSPEFRSFARSHFLPWISLKSSTTQDAAWRERHLSVFLNNN